MRKKYLYLGACHSVWNSLETRVDHHGGGRVACARQGDLDTYCLVFLSESVVWTRLGYFLGDGTTLHLRVEVRCMDHTEHDWLELWIDDDYLLSVCWTSECLCKLMIFVNVFFTNYGCLIFVLIPFIINSPLAIFVPCGWYLWWSQFLYYFGSELCFVNQLLHSWFHNYFVELRM